jgi:spore germination cell wall hydrolase CwlJ-like protein
MENEVDIVILSLTLWREARGESPEGKTAVANVIANRVKKNKSSFYEECVKPKQFSSMTSPGDSQLILFAKPSDPSWITCQNLAYSAVMGSLPDITNGSTLYYNPKSIKTDHTIALGDGAVVPFPEPWSVHHVSETGFIGNHLFLREV